MDTPLKDLVRLGKIRWRLERGYQHLKEDVGLDQFEGRTWLGWNRHVTLTMGAYAFLLEQQMRRQKSGSAATRRDPATRSANDPALVGNLDRHLHHLRFPYPKPI